MPLKSLKEDELARESHIYILPQTMQFKKVDRYC